MKLKYTSLLIGLFLFNNVNSQVVTGFNNITDVDGNTHSLSTYLNDGKFVLLNFYLETCGNCVASAPMIQSIYNDFGQNQCQLIILNMIVQSSPPYFTDQECVTWMANAGCPSPPNFNHQASSGSLGWGQFYNVHGGGFAQSYLVSPIGDSVVYAHAGGVLDDVALRSVINNSLTIGSSSIGTSSITACDSYTWNGQIITNSGSYDQTFTNNSGCDSLHTLVATINLSTSGSASYSSPQPVIWQGMNISTTGSYTQTFINRDGCDSIATLNFILSTNTGVEIINPTIKNVTKVLDFLGREVRVNDNSFGKLRFYILSDGTVEKRIIVE